MDQRQLDKERIRLTREIAMLETQLSAAIKGKEEKLEENKQIREEIAKLEEENKALEEETRRLDEEIAGLDDEFKNAQIEAGRLRREIKIAGEKSEAENKKAAELRNEIAKLDKHLETLRREIKQEIEDRRNLESRLRKTNAHIDAMKEHAMARFVTRRLEKQDWYQRAEEPLPSWDGEDESEIEEVTEVSAVEAEAATEAPSEEAPTEATSGEEEKKDEGGIDFSTD
jgi:chromosome segregation ATPase